MNTQTLSIPSSLPVHTTNPRLQPHHLIAYRRAGLTYPQIADLVKCDPKTVFRAAKAIDGEIIATEQWVRNESFLIAYARRLTWNYYLSTLSKNKPDHKAAVSFGILFDKQRLQDDKSTSNIDYHAVIEAKQRKQGELTLLRNLKQLPGVNK